MVKAAHKAIEDADVEATVASLRRTSDALTETVESLGKSTRNLEPLNEEALRAMAALREASEAFRDLSNTLQRQPNAVIFGRAASDAPGLRR